MPILRSPAVLASMSSVALLALGALAGCSGGADDGPDPEPTPPERDARFVGLWAVEQPTHAAYEVTYYTFGADGTVTLGPSDPADCLGHLGRHCVTGSVARCVPAMPGERCQADLTCVFGDTWSSQGSATLVVTGDCSDGVARPIVVRMNPDATGNSEWPGAGGELVSVGGETGWSHDNWDWSFRKCPPGTGPGDCLP